MGKRIISDDDVFGLLSKLKDGKDKDGPFFTDEHKKLSKLDRFVEDFILTGIYLIEKLDIKDVVRFECDFLDKNNMPLRAIQSDGTIVPLDFDTYINTSTPKQYAYLSEAQNLIAQGVRPNPICEKIKEKSPAYLEALKK